MPSNFPDLFQLSHDMNQILVRIDAPGLIVAGALVDQAIHSVDHKSKKSCDSENAPCSRMQYLLIFIAWMTPCSGSIRVITRLRRGYN